MQTLEQANNGAADLYWLAFLLTGSPEPSIDVTLEALDSEEAATSFFSTWMLAWSRRVVIAKALSAIREELAVSARRTATRDGKKADLPPRNWALGRDTTKGQVERALLAIDVFPRCALLLLLFEGISLEDAAILLNADRDLVRKAQMIGVQALTRNLARMQGGWTPTAIRPCIFRGRTRHA